MKEVLHVISYRSPGGVLSNDISESEKHHCTVHLNVVKMVNFILFMRHAYAMDWKWPLKIRMLKP